MQTQNQTLRISIDGSFDAHEAGYAGEGRELEAAWVDAMESISEAIGVDVKIHRGPACQSGPDSWHELDDGQSLENVLWQAAHNLCQRDSDGNWSAKVPSRETIASLRKLSSTVLT